MNNNRFWLDCFENLKSRGIKNILFLSVDNNRNMKRTAKIAFPDIVFVDSLTDIVPKFFKYSTERDAKKLASRLHSLYIQKTLSDYKEALKGFNSVYNNVIQQKLVEKYLCNYVTDIEEIYEKLGDIKKYFGFISFKKREWILILNDLIQIYPKINFI